MDKYLRIVLFCCTVMMSLCNPSLAQTCRSQTFTNNEIYAECIDLSALSSYLHWNFHTANNTADIAFRKTGTPDSNWVAWALNPSGRGMAGAQALVAHYHSNGTLISYTSPVASTGISTLSQGALSFGVSNLRAEHQNQVMTIYATLDLGSGLLSTQQVWQEGPVSGGTPGIHAMNNENRNSFGNIDFQTGTVVAGTDTTTRKRNRHGVLNAVSWGVLMPMGAMIARYVKVFKVANPAWFYLHVACQFSAYAIGVAGWATGIKLGSDSPGITHDLHRNIGITLFTFGTLQMFALLLRPKPDHKYRLYWNIYHQSIGYATIVLSIINVYEGFDILDPEKKWKRIYTGILIFLGAVAALLEAITWVIVLKRKKTASSDKYVNGANGHGSRPQQSV